MTALVLGNPRLSGGLFDRRPLLDDPRDEIKNWFELHPHGLEMCQYILDNTKVFYKKHEGKWLVMAEFNEEFNAMEFTIRYIDDRWDAEWLS